MFLARQRPGRLVIMQTVYFKRIAACAAALIMGFALRAGAADVYVVPPGTAGVEPDGIFTNWATAATNVQDAIDAAHVGEGDTVFITNGLYLLPAQITVNKGVTLRSYKDGETAREETIIDANNYEGKPANNRVMTLSHSGAVLDGLTIQGGLSGNGGGVFISASQMITNCVIRDNHATIGNVYGGGIYVSGSFGVITHSMIVSNVCSVSGGGLDVVTSAIGKIEYCEISWNDIDSSFGGHGGGGVRITSDDVELRWSTIHNNRVPRGGGGIFLTGDSLVEYCRIVSNPVSGAADGPGINMRDGVVRNSLIADNGSEVTRYAVRLDGGGRVENCTIVNNNNLGLSSAGGVIVNTIIAGHNNTDVAFDALTVFTNSLCPTVDLNIQGTGNIQDDPAFVDPDENEFQLQLKSPAVNAGMKLDWMDEDAVDLDGNPRIDRLHGIVDIGAYEYMFAGTLFKFY